MENKPEKITLADALTIQHVEFTQKLIANTLNLKRHIIAEKEDPNYVQPPQQMGAKPMTVKELIAFYKKAIKNSREYLSMIEELLENGTNKNIIKAIEKLQKHKDSGIVIPTNQKIQGK